MKTSSYLPHCPYKATVPAVALVVAALLVVIVVTGAAVVGFAVVGAALVAGLVDVASVVGAAVEAGGALPPLPRNTCTVGPGIWYVPAGLL
jgi:hypothetical protein